MADVRSGRDIDSALVKKGFLRFHEGDHVRYRFYGPSGDNPVARTKISHGMLGRTVGAKLISLMAKQLHLTKKQFLQLIDCTMTEKAYRETLRGKGIAV